MVDTYLWAMRCPVFRRREPHPGFRTELENLTGDDKGKGASGSSARPKVPMHRSGADYLVVPMRRSNVRGGKGVGHPRRDRLGQVATGGADWFRRKAAAFAGWHEPCESRGSRTESVRGSGCNSPGLLGGNAGEQPDRGIAGRNSSADDEKERDPPGAFFYLGLGPTS